MRDIFVTKCPSHVTNKPLPLHRLSETNHPSESALHMNQKNQPSRLWFMSRGYQKHPRHNLWGKEGCSYFLNAYGHKLAHQYSPRMRAKTKDRGYHGPVMSDKYDPRLCHILMGEIFYGERPVFINSKGNPYFGICHHLIQDPLKYEPENLLCWLTYSQHSKADKRRRALEAVVPDGDLTLFPYGRLRYLQDPRVLTDEEFSKELESIRAQGYHRVDPLAAAAEERRKYA